MPKRRTLSEDDGGGEGVRDLLADPCKECGGACCEGIQFNFKGLSPDFVKWAGFHGEQDGERVTFNCRCTHLTSRGRCGIYEERPEVCRKFEVGSPSCLAAIHKYRGATKAARVVKLIARMGKEQ